jgi:hypothetical protein
MATASVIRHLETKKKVFLKKLSALVADSTGIGMSMMNSVPAEHRGVASGMRATFQNAATLVSMAAFFSIVVIGLASSLPTALFSGLTHAGVPAQVAEAIAHLPPTAALFAAFLGYNPMAILLPASVQHALPAASRAYLLSKSYFPNLISSPFMVGLRAVFYLSAVLCLIAAVASMLRGQRYIHDYAAQEAVGDGSSQEATSREHSETR